MYFFKTFKKSTAPYKVHNMGLRYIKKIIEHFTQNFVTYLSKLWVWDLGSEIRDLEKNLFWIPDPGPGVKKAPDTQH
jgi:hypothetical protein